MARKRNDVEGTVQDHFMPSKRQAMELLNELQAIAGVYGDIQPLVERAELLLNDICEASEAYDRANPIPVL